MIADAFDALMLLSSKSEINSDEELSKLPVGSSASIKSGLLIIALAIAILCCSPPDKLEGLWFNLFFK